MICRMKHTIAVAAAALTSPVAQAGAYSDEMGKCLVSATSDKDKTDLVRWIFANAALHPEVASIASITPTQREEINRAAGQLLERLLTVACRKQSKEALRYEGPMAMQLSFQVLGQVAMGTLMSHPAVGKGFGEIGRHVDEARLRDLPNAPD